MMEDLGDSVENSYISNNAVGARQRRALNGNSYSTIPTQASSSHDADSLKRRNASFGAPSLNSYLKNPIHSYHYSNQPHI